MGRGRSSGCEAGTGEEEGVGWTVGGVFGPLDTGDRSCRSFWMGVELWASVEFGRPLDGDRSGGGGEGVCAIRGCFCTFGDPECLPPRGVIDFGEGWGPLRGESSFLFVLEPD